MKLGLLALLLGALAFFAWRAEQSGARSAGERPRDTSGYGSQTPAARAFANLVDEYLDTWAGHHPSIAAGNGLHAHDGELEDYSATAVAAEVAWLQTVKQRLRDLPRAELPPDELVDHRILDGIVDAWLLELDGIKNHQ
ncbi:MAG: hypothetical protein JNJ98_00985, partial [Gemmatimonadetes bacterium]|nr:hypothetical protein [Gemmatimonadota bacterium]